MSHVVYATKKKNGCLSSLDNVLPSSAVFVRPPCGYPILGMEVAMLSPGAAETPTCAVCSQKQSVGSYAALHGKIYCKPHFKQLKETVTKLFGTATTAQHKHKWGQKLTSAEPSGGDDRKAKKYSEEDQQKQQQQQQPPRSVSDSAYFWKSHVAAPAAAIQSPRRIPLPSTASSHCSPAILTCTPFRLSKQHRDEVVVDIMGRFRPPIASVRPMRPRPSQTAEAHVISEDVTEGLLYGSIYGNLNLDGTHKQRPRSGAQQDSLYSTVAKLN